MWLREYNEHRSKVPHIERILPATVAGAFALDFPRASLSALAFSKATTCASVRGSPSGATFACNAFNRFRIVSRSCRSQIQRTPAGEMVRAGLRRSFATRTCPQVGWSIAKCTMACSTSRATRFLRIGFCGEISWSAASPPVSYSSFKRYKLFRLYPSADSRWRRFQLLGQFQNTHFGLDDLLLPSHCPYSFHERKDST